MFVDPDGSSDLDLRSFPADADWIYLSVSVLSNPLRPVINDEGAIRCGKDTDNLMELRKKFADRKGIVPFVYQEKLVDSVKIYQCFLEFTGCNAQQDYVAAKAKWTGRMEFSSGAASEFHKPDIIKIYNFSINWVNQIPEDEYKEFTKPN